MIFNMQFVIVSLATVVVATAASSLSSVAPVSASSNYGLTNVTMPLGTPPLPIAGPGMRPLHIAIGRGTQVCIQSLPATACSTIRPPE
jgi:hypothetical protein